MEFMLQNPFTRKLHAISALTISVIFVAQSMNLSAQQPRSVTTSVTPSGSGAVASTMVDGPGSGLQFNPSRVLVHFRSGAREFLPGSTNPRAFPGDPDLFLVTNPPGLSVAQVVARYKANPNVLYAEPDYIVKVVATPNDPAFLNSQQWDMTKISAPTAWNSQTNAGDIVAAIIDTGVDYTHPDLQGNIWTDPSDSTVHGFTCIGGACNPGGLDDFGHGTHVAGTIGAATNNGIGMAGINWSIKMLSLKFLDSNGSGAISDAVLAFNKVAALKSAGVNIRLTSNSWGGGGFSQALKDAMAAVESAGIIDICAAGNSGQNADADPMYPAAYDNRGIVSVLAADSNDLGAGFTNYGLESVDIAAPGVNTYSTVPTGACALCDPSGYKLLSGTSMATPHVSGVAAALLHLHPALTAAEARDILLDPASYDSLSDARAKSTSSGGRLNFAKVITNPRASSPITLNNFPSLTMGANVFASAGATVNLTATPSDPDAADVPGLRMAWGRSISTGTQWLFGWMLGSLFPNPSGGSTSFNAPSASRTTSVPYDAAVADNRGGGAHGRTYVTVSPAASSGTLNTGALTATPSSGPVGTTVTVGFPVTDPDAHSIAPAWDVWAAGQYGSSGSCCYTSPAVGMTFNSTGVWRISAMAVDQELITSARPSTVVRIGTPTPTGEPPIAAVSLDKLSGPVPLTVNVNMSGSTDPDGTIQYYYIGCGGVGFASGSSSPFGTCTYDTPGAYWMLLQVQDNTGQMDLVSAYIVATPAAGGGGDTTPPTVSITAPANNAVVSGVVNIAATATDNAGGSGVKQVEFRLDDPASGTLLGTDTSSPYNASWDATGATPGSTHTIYATATDNSSNKTTASVAVKIATPPPAAPTLAITSPLPVTRKSTVTITATDTVPIVRVDFYVNNTLTCTDTAAPFTCAWKVPNAAGRTYSLTATATDSQSQVSPLSTPLVVSPK